jgi:cyclin H
VHLRRTRPLHLFAQVEEERIELADLTRYSRLSSEREAAEKLILANEESILATLGYEIVVRSPHRALGGFLASLRSRRRGTGYGTGDGAVGMDGGAGAGGSSGDEPILGADAMAAIESKARDFISHALCADAPLLFSPQQLAMVGVVRGAAAAGVDLRVWLGRWLRRSGDDGPGDGEEAVRFQQVRSRLAASCALVLTAGCLMVANSLILPIRCGAAQDRLGGARVCRLILTLRARVSQPHIRSVSALTPSPAPLRPNSNPINPSIPSAPRCTSCSRKSARRSMPRGVPWTRPPWPGARRSRLAGRR